MFARLGLLVLGLTLTGCASQIMNGYVGQPLLAPILDYGPPITAYDMGDGTRAFIWARQVQVMVPGQVMTTGTASSTMTGTATFIGNQALLSGQSSGNLYSTTTIIPPQQYSYECNYVLFAVKSQNDIEGPAAWRIVSFKKPNLMCE